MNFSIPAKFQKVMERSLTLVITLVHEVQNCSMLDAVKERGQLTKMHANCLCLLASEVDIQVWIKFARKMDKLAFYDLGAI